MRKIDIKNTLTIVAFIVTVILTLDAAFGSYQESEPHAGNILFGACAVMILLGIILYLKFKPSIFKEK